MIYNKYNNGVRNINISDNISNPMNENSIFEFDYLIESNRNIDILCEELLLEDFSFNDFFNKLKKIVIDGLKKFIRIAENILYAFSKLIHDNKIYAEKYRYAIYHGFDILAMSDANLDNTYTGIMFDSDAINKFSNNISVDAVNKNLRKIMNYAKEYAIESNIDLSYFNMVRQDIISSIIGDGKRYSYETPEEISKHINNICIIDDGVNLIHYYTSGKTICTVLRDKDSKDIKDEYRRVKEVTSSCIDRIDEFREIMIKRDDESGHIYDLNLGRKIFNELSLHVKFVQSVCHASSITLSKIRFEELKQARNFAKECVKAYENSKQGA